MKNDLSFIIDSRLSLYEHQSTWNPNMPLRGLFYFTQQYEGLLSVTDENIYGRKRIGLPTPEYIVFYNGSDMRKIETSCICRTLFRKDGAVVVWNAVVRL